MTVRVSGKIKNTVGFHLHAKGGDVDFCLRPLKRFQQQSGESKALFQSVSGSEAKGSAGMPALPINFHR